MGLVASAAAITSVVIRVVTMAFPVILTVLNVSSGCSGIMSLSSTVAISVTWGVVGSPMLISLMWGLVVAVVRSKIVAVVAKSVLARITICFHLFLCHQ